MISTNTETTERQQDAAVTALIEDHQKMKVQTSRFGTLEVDVEKIITMVQPFLGFPESNRFILHPHGPDSPCMWLQSMDNPELAFVVIHPSLILTGYKPEIAKQEREELQADADSDLELLVILTIPRNNPSVVTANLLGPVLINTNKRLAKQVLLDPIKYDCCWPLGSKAA